MVAVIKAGQSIRRILNYNELKVKAGVAECLGAINYPIDADKMTTSSKLSYFAKRIALNRNVRINSVHISFNFDPSESKLTKEILSAIADNYMDKIGFGKQPYLVYQHFDAAHPHLHIVTTNVEANGKRIDLHHLGIRKSEPARKSIETEFNLVVAEQQRKSENYQLKPISLGKVIYGKSQTRKAIQNVLETVLSQYKYTSLHELNAVLNQYNVHAEAGASDSRLNKHGGLQYRVQDDAGNPVGVPIKASLFYNKPTLKFLEERFRANEPKRLPYQGRVRNAIDKALLGRRLTLSQLIAQLEKQGIRTILRASEGGLIYGITYVDHQTKTVFNGSDLGKLYSAKAVQERCITDMELLAQTQQQARKHTNQSATFDVWPEGQYGSPNNVIQNIINLAVEPDKSPDSIPGQLMKKRKKKRSLKNP